MDKTKKILLISGIVLVAILLALGIWYLISSKNKSSTEKIELVYFGLWEPEPNLIDVIDKYEEENPNVSIKYTQKRITQYEENIYEWLSDPQKTPDIVRINNTWTYKFQDRLSSIPPEIMTKSEYQEVFYPTAYDDFTGTDGEIYAIPLEIDGLALYYNVDLFEAAGITEPPKDWDTFSEVAERLTERDADGEITQAGAAIGCSNNIKHSADIVYALMMQNNVEMTSLDGTEAIFDSTRGQQSVQFYTEFAEEADIDNNETPTNVWSCSLANDLDMFAAGKLAMMFGPSWTTFDLINMNPSIYFDTATLPQLTGNTEDINYSMYWGESVSAQSQNQLEAWKFVKYLSEREQLLSMYAQASTNRQFGEPYSRIEMREDLINSPYVDVFIEMAPTMKTWKMGDQSTSESAMNTAIRDVNDGRESISSALRLALETINLKLQEIY